MNIVTKKCTKCEQLKSVSDFSVRLYKKTGNTGLTAWCKKCMALASGRWKKEHPEIAKNLKREWRQRHPDRSRVQSLRNYKTYKAAHPDRVKESQDKWASQNHDKTREKSRRRRAIKKNVVGEHFTEKQFIDLCVFYENKCLCCKRSDVKLSADHVIPIGPPHSDEINNIQPLCKSCNSRKGKKTVDYRE